MVRVHTSAVGMVHVLMYDDIHNTVGELHKVKCGDNELKCCYVT